MLPSKAGISKSAVITRVGGIHVQQGAIVGGNENQGVNALPLWFVKGDSQLTPGQSEVFTVFVIHRDGGGMFNRIG